MKDTGLDNLFGGQVFDITVDNNKDGLKFTYSYNNQGFDPCKNSIDVSQKSILVFQIKHSTFTPKGLKFAGIVKQNPFNEIIDKVIISEDGQQLLLEDLHTEINAECHFQILFSADEFSSLLLTPDPQIINKRTHN